MNWFQMKIMHRTIGTNVILNEMDVTNKNKCSFCLIAKDTVQHIFWECTQPKVLQWTRFLVLLNEKCTSCYRSRLSECLILFWIDDDSKTENVFDFILLLAKQCLYKCKIEKQLPNTEVFRKRLFHKFKIHTMLKWAAHVQIFLPGGILTNLCFQTNVLNKKCPRYMCIISSLSSLRICIYLSLSSMFFHFMFISLMKWA